MSRARASAPRSVGATIGGARSRVAVSTYDDGAPARREAAVNHGR